MDSSHRQILRQLPSVDEMVLYFDHQSQAEKIPRTVLVKAIRQTLEAIRQRLLNLEAAQVPASLDRVEIISEIRQQLVQSQQARLIPLINATGVIIHTNLGRSPLAEAAINQIFQVAVHYSNLEYTLAEGKRGSRHDHLEYLLRELTGAEAALVVNNNAGAVFLTLNTMAGEEQYSPGNCRGHRRGIYLLAG